jgi:hypothetical protein
MSFPLSSFLSGLAYLAFCLLIAVFRSARSLRAAGYRPSGDERPAGNDGGPVPSSPEFLVSLFASGLISLSLFLFMPCGVLPSLFPVSLGASIVVAGLAAASGFRGGEGIRRQGSVPLCFGVSLAVIARYAQERGVPGDLYALDAYVAMPLIGVAEGGDALGFCILAAASLLVLWQSSASGEQPLTGSEAPLAALAAELWMLAAIAFWVCLFFPASFAFAETSGIAVLGELVLNALFFWFKVLAVAWLLEKSRRKYPRSAPFHALIPLAFLGLGAWLLLDAAAR